MKKTLLLLSLLILAGCKESGDKVMGAPTPGTDLPVASFIWKVRTPEQLETIYITNGEVLSEMETVDGFVGKDPLGNYVVYTASPKFVDDEVTCTLGHEVMHIALGDFHSEGDAR